MTEVTDVSWNVIAPTCVHCKFLFISPESSVMSLISTADYNNCWGMWLSGECRVGRRCFFYLKAYRETEDIWRYLSYICGDVGQPFSQSHFMYKYGMLLFNNIIDIITKCPHVMRYQLTCKSFVDWYIVQTNQNQGLEDRCHKSHLLCCLWTSMGSYLSICL